MAEIGAWTGCANATIVNADMAVILTVRSGDAEVPPLTLDAPRIVIGRAKSCDLRLPDPSVSPRHASLRQRGNDYLILDEGSTNGTFVEDVRLPPGAPRLVRPGDKIRLGRIWLQVELDAALADPQPRARAAEIALSLVAGALSAEGHASCPLVVVEAGPGAPKELELARFNASYRVGRGAKCELQLRDPASSTPPCELLRVGSEVYARNSSDTDVLKLAGESIPPGRQRLWVPGSELELGGWKLSLRDPVLPRLVELEACADEVLGDEAESAAAPEARTRQRATRRERPSPREAVPGSQPRAQLAATPRSPVASGSWQTVDWVVAALACLLFAISLVALLWLFE